MTYQEVMAAAKGEMGPFCKACPVCNGIACKNAMPGPGSKGSGLGFPRNYNKWQEICINLDTICENAPISTEVELFGETYKYPFFAAPIGAMNWHYGEKYNDLDYNNLLVESCAKEGILAFTGDGVYRSMMTNACLAMKAVGGVGVPTIKPWDKENVFARIDEAKAAGVKFIAMDIDAAGLPFLKNTLPPAGRKTVAELKEIIDYAGVPFVLKGIMTVKGAKKALEAGAAGIVVSNHGGRVLDGCPATAEVLADIAEAVGGKMKIFVDGGIRTGMDVFKALALGADAVLIGRPFVNAIYGAGAEGVHVYAEHLGDELAETMMMCGVHNLEEITKDCVFVK